MRKVKNSEVLSMHNAIMEFEKIGDKIPFKLNYALSKHKDVIIKHAQDFESARINICKEYTDKDVSGNPIINDDNSFKLTEDNFKVVNEMVLNLLEEEVEVPDYQVSVNDLPNEFGFTNSEFPSNFIFMKYLCRD